LSGALPFTANNLSPEPLLKKENTISDTLHFNAPDKAFPSINIFSISVYLLKQHKTIRTFSK
jgi:hypothetical protein